MNLCIIPARAGSKRIPGKNKRDFCGMPIISHVVDVAERCIDVNEIIISTDDDEIREMYPLYWYPREDHLRGDDVPLCSVVDGIRVPTWTDNILVLLPTAVFVESVDLVKASRMLSGMELDAVVSVNKYHHPIERAMRMDDYLLEMIAPKFGFTRTQDLKPSYHDAGQFYWLNYNSFKDQKKIFMRRTAGYIIDSVDIDDESDWSRAEAIHRARGILGR